MGDAGPRRSAGGKARDGHAAADLHAWGRLGRRGEHGFHQDAPAGQPLVALVAVLPAAAQLRVAARRG